MASHDGVLTNPKKDTACSDHEQVRGQVRGPRPPDYPQPQLQGGHPQRSHGSLQVSLDGLCVLLNKRGQMHIAHSRHISNTDCKAIIGQAF